MPRTGVSRRHWMIYAIQDLTTSHTSQSPQSDALSSMIKQRNVSQSELHVSFYTQASKYDRVECYPIRVLKDFIDRS